jgi:ABC-type nitrate/sulfonate/bicarbonate transport system substrate-binding protein
MKIKSEVEKIKKSYLFIFFVLILVISGCTQNIEENELQEITVKLKWLHQAQFAGNYVAVEKGFYANEELKVNLVPFSFEDPTIDSVVNETAVFGITGADELILARSKGLTLKAFAVIYKINPVCAYSLKESGIANPQDFIGKNIGLERGTNVEILYYAMMGKLDINRSQINELTIGYDANELLNGITDVSTGYLINEPHQVIEAGYEVNTILMADYGVNMYADVLFATEDTINNNPELVEKFLRATLEGWQYAIDHNGEAIDIVLEYVNNGSRSHEMYMLNSSIPLIQTGETPIGWMEKDEWVQAQDILLEQNIVGAEINIENVYTMDFLEKISDET